MNHSSDNNRAAVEPNPSLDPKVPETTANYPEIKISEPPTPRRGAQLCALPPEPKHQEAKQ